jgi:hypothetical protein
MPLLGNSLRRWCCWRRSGCCVNWPSGRNETTLRPEQTDS